MIRDFLQMFDPMPAAIVAGIAGIVGALAGAAVGGAARREEEAKGKNGRIRSAINVVVETFLLRWRRAMEFTSPSMPISEEQLQDLAADVAGFRGFGRDLVDIRSVQWRGLYLQWYTDIHELHVAFISLSRKEPDEGNPMAPMDERLRRDATDLIDRIKDVGGRLRLAVDVFYVGKRGLVTLPGIPRTD